MDVCRTLRSTPSVPAVERTGPSLPRNKAFGVTLPRVRSEVKPRYTAAAMQAKIQGTVIMTAVVRTDGTPADIAVTKSLDAEHGLDREAAAALAQWRFEPGRRDEAPVPVRVTIEMRFTLKK